MSSVFPRDRTLVMPDRPVSRRLAGEKSAVLLESQAVQESLALPGSDIHLVYHSSRAKGYKSIIQLQLTPDEVPKSLTMVRVKITIEGVVHEKVFEADPNIQYTYAWDRLNEYRQVRKSAQHASVSRFPDQIFLFASVRVPDLGRLAI